MIVSANVLELLIMISTALVAIAPVILIFLWLKDKKGGKLW